jgi:hypothetical protein
MGIFMSKFYFFILLFIISFNLYSKRVLYRSEILISEKKIFNPTDPETNPDEFPKPIMSQLEVLRKTSEILSRAGKSKIHYVEKNGARFSNNISAIELENDGDLSKFKKIEYSLNGSPYIEYPGSIPLRKSGMNTIKYRAFDKLGNTEDYKSLEIFVDDISPDLGVKLIGQTFFKNDMLYYQSGMTINVSATDNESGIKDIYVNVNDDGFIPFASLTERFNETKFYRIQIFALDNVLNRSKEYVYNFSIDGESPLVYAKPIDTIYYDNSHHCSGRSKFQLLASDRDSGVRMIQYKINADEKWTNYADVIKMPEKIETLDLEYKAIDNVGNESDVQSFSCKVTRESPKTKMEVK